MGKGTRPLDLPSAALARRSVYSTADFTTAAPRIPTKGWEILPAMENQALRLADDLTGRSGERADLPTVAVPVDLLQQVYDIPEDFLPDLGTRLFRRGRHRYVTVQMASWLATGYRLTTGKATGDQELAAFADRITDAIGEGSGIDCFLAPQYLAPEGINQDLPMPAFPGVPGGGPSLAPDDVADAVNRVAQEFADANRARIMQGHRPLEDLLGNHKATLSSQISQSLVYWLACTAEHLVENAPNRYPDLLPAGFYKNPPSKHAVGIEVKASTRRYGWEAHNASRGWFLVAQFETDNQYELLSLRKPMRFVRVMLAPLSEKAFVVHAGKEGGRTRTASISGTASLDIHRAELYRAPDYSYVYHPKPDAASTSKPKSKTAQPSGRRSRSAVVAGVAAD